mmetsp:Transcript_13770/g.15832  ORF Transcript_13770/g.15832 Transcript_13770/m.15832 type:complete len:191 (+) Transcript_13770:105-677(+)
MKMKEVVWELQEQKKKYIGKGMHVMCVYTRIHRKGDSLDDDKERNKTKNIFHHPTHQLFPKKILAFFVYFAIFSQREVRLEIVFFPKKISICRRFHTPPVHSYDGIALPAAANLLLTTLQACGARNPGSVGTPSRFRMISAAAARYSGVASLSRTSAVSTFGKRSSAASSTASIGGAPEVASCRIASTAL